MTGDVVGANNNSCDSRLSREMLLISLRLETHMIERRGRIYLCIRNLNTEECGWQMKIDSTQVKISASKICLPGHAGSNHTHFPSNQKLSILNEIFGMEGI